MTQQDVFDTVVARLRDGRGQADDPATGKCVYRTPDGVPCAVGAVIPDGHPAVHVDGDVHVLVAEMEAQGDEVPAITGNVDLLEELQELHDDASMWDHELGRVNTDGESVLAAVALKHGLVYAP